MKAVVLGLSYCLFFGWAGFRSYDVYQIASRAVPKVPQVKVQVSTPSAPSATSPEGRWEGMDGASEFYIERRGKDLLVDGSRVFIAEGDDEWTEQNPSGKVPASLCWDPDAGTLHYIAFGDAGGMIDMELQRVP